MSTRPQHDASSIARDARLVLGAARQDLASPDFGAEVSAHELDVLESEITELEHDAGLRATVHQQKLAAGVHTAQIRARMLKGLSTVRRFAALRLAGDASAQHTFGVGHQESPASTREMLAWAHQVLGAAESHPALAPKVGLGAPGVQSLEDLVHALEGADLAHQQSAVADHLQAVATDSLAHVISAETAHLRLVAHVVFHDQAEKLARYASTLPRHQVVHRPPKNPPVAAT